MATVKTYIINAPTNREIESLRARLRDAAGRLVDSRAKTYMTAHSVDYRTALHAVLDADPNLKTAYVDGE